MQLNKKIDINSLNLKKEIKQNKSYSLSVKNVKAIEQLANVNNNKDSTVLDLLLTELFKN